VNAPGKTMKTTIDPSTYIIPVKGKMRLLAWPRARDDVRLSARGAHARRAPWVWHWTGVGFCRMSGAHPRVGST